MAKAPASETMNPQSDFKGDVKVNDHPPTKEDLERVAMLPVLDVNKKSHTFKSLWADDENGSRRVLVIFIRHFFCGNCQEYLRTLSSSLNSSSLSSLSPPTSVVIIGCGSPDLIPMYAHETACPFPIYADPTRQLYRKLGMTSTLALGPKTPEYMHRSLTSVIVSSIVQGLKSGRKMLSGGNSRQVGGEFVFLGGKVVWCQRMRNTRDHAEIAVIRQKLGLDGERPPQRDRWSSVGLTQGLGRRLSERRRSWGGGRSLRKGRKEEVGNGTPQRSAMDGVAEEGGQGDALAKLEGSMNGNGHVNGHAVGLMKEENAVDGTVDEDEPVEATSINMQDGCAKTTTNGVANGNVNGTPVDGKAAIVPLTSSEETTVNDATNG